MAAEAKTKPTGESVAAFLTRVTDGDRRKDCATLVRLMEEATGARGVVWGKAIVGFGSYDITYADGRVSPWPVVGFSPRAQDLTLYIGRSAVGLTALLSKLGKHKMSGSCLHIKRLSDVDMAVLGKVIAGSVKARAKQG
jgi:hypothetical protein